MFIEASVGNIAVEGIECAETVTWIRRAQALTLGEERIRKRYLPAFRQGLLTADNLFIGLQNIFSSGDAA